MDRMTTLVQATCVAFLISTAMALAYRGGGRRRLWIATGVSLALLEALVVWSSVSARSEGPLWLAVLGTIPPILLASWSVALLARKQTPLAMQIAAGTAMGLVGFVVTAFVAYIVLVARF